MTRTNARAVAVIAELEGMVLYAFATADHSYGETDTYYSFLYLAKETGLPECVVRCVCRGLTDKGLLRFHKGLFSEDGRLAGAGYALTPKGAGRVRSRGWLNAAPPAQRMANTNARQEAIADWLERMRGGEA